MCVIIIVLKHVKKECDIWMRCEKDAHASAKCTKAYTVREGTQI